MTKQETETDVTIHNGGEGNGNLKKIFEDPFFWIISLELWKKTKTNFLGLRTKNTHSQKKIIVKTKNFR